MLIFNKLLSEFAHQEDKKNKRMYSEDLNNAINEYQVIYPYYIHIYRIE